jgi:hypothetical protein
MHARRALATPARRRFAPVVVAKTGWPAAIHSQIRRDPGGVVAIMLRRVVTEWSQRLA